MNKTYSTAKQILAALLLLVFVCAQGARLVHHHEVKKEASAAHHAEGWIKAASCAVCDYQVTKEASFSQPAFVIALFALGQVFFGQQYHTPFTPPAYQVPHRGPPADSVL